jgi:hypothetical protein
MNSSSRLLARVVFALLLLTAASHASDRISDLAKNFARPPASARPWIFWFWLNGNLSSNGLTAALEAPHEPECRGSAGARKGSGGTLQVWTWHRVRPLNRNPRRYPLL